MTWLLVFFATAVADAFWTLYFIAADERRAFAAGVWSALIVALGGFTVTEYARDRWLLTAAVAGGFAGTFATVMLKKRVKTSGAIKQCD